MDGREREYPIPSLTFFSSFPIFANKLYQRKQLETGPRGLGKYQLLQQRMSAVSDVTQKIWPLLQQGKSAVSDVTQQLWPSLQQECQLSVTSVNSYGCRCNKGCQLSAVSDVTHQLWPSLQPRMAAVCDVT